MSRTRKAIIRKLHDNLRDWQDIYYDSKCSHWPQSHAEQNAQAEHDRKTCEAIKRSIVEIKNKYNNDAEFKKMKELTAL